MIDFYIESNNDTCRVNIKSVGQFICEILQLDGDISYGQEWDGDDIKYHYWPEVEFDYHDFAEKIYNLCEIDIYAGLDKDVYEFFESRFYDAGFKSQFSFFESKKQEIMSVAVFLDITTDRKPVVYYFD